MQLESYTTKSRFDMCGQRLPADVIAVENVITQGLAKRLVRHASERMKEAGFAAMMEGAQVTVSTPDGESAASDRTYCVKWTNASGGWIAVVGIHTRSGWPTLDFGFEIGAER